MTPIIGAAELAAPACGPCPCHCGGNWACCMNCPGWPCSPACPACSGLKGAKGANVVRVPISVSGCVAKAAPARMGPVGEDAGDSLGPLRCDALGEGRDSGRGEWHGEPEDSPETPASSPPRPCDQPSRPSEELAAALLSRAPLLLLLLRLVSGPLAADASDRSALPLGAFPLAVSFSTPSRLGRPLRSPLLSADARPTRPLPLPRAAARLRVLSAAPALPFERSAASSVGSAARRPRTLS